MFKKHTYIHTYTQTQTQAQAQTQTYTRTLTRTRARVRTDTDTHTHIYTHTRVHTHYSSLLSQSTLPEIQFISGKKIWDFSTLLVLKNRWFVVHIIWLRHFRQELFGTNEFFDIFLFIGSITDSKFTLEGKILGCTERERERERGRERQRGREKDRERERERERERVTRSLTTFSFCHSE